MVINFPLPKLLKEHLKQSHIYLQKVTFSFTYLRLVEGTLEDMEDGFQISNLALSKATQMILNLVCNDNMNFNDGSCCKSSDHRTTLQTIAFSILGGAILMSLIVLFYEFFCRRKSGSRYYS